MHLALELADRAAETGEVPVGAVLIRDEQCVIGEGYNQPISALDPTAHAEIIEASTKALSLRGNYRLPASTLYVTIEPCLMCVGALIHASEHRSFRCAGIKDWCPRATLAWAHIRVIIGLK